MTDYHCPAHGKACKPQPYDLSPPTEEDREWTHHNNIPPPGLRGILLFLAWVCGGCIVDTVDLNKRPK